MQLLPSTAREIAPRIGIRWTSDDLLFDPEINVALGAYYLKQMLQRFDGNLDAALAAYERGPGRLQMRLARSVDDVPLGYSNRVWAAILELQARVLA
jgi:soluble lytic murein transglycosylase